MKKLLKGMVRARVGTESASAKKALLNLEESFKELIDLSKEVKEEYPEQYPESDGEILAMFVKPVLQSAWIGLKDRKGFQKNLF